MSKKTAGQIASDLMKKVQGHEIENAIDVQRASEKEYIDNLFWAVNHNFKTVPCTPKCFAECSTRDPITNKDFYIVVLTKQEPSMVNIFRNYFITATCVPTPTYDQAVWRFNRKLSGQNLLWIIPNKEDCIMYKQNASIVDKEEHQLLQYVLDFYDGVLDKKAVELNKEKNTGVILYRKDPSSVIL